MSSQFRIGIPILASVLIGTFTLAHILQSKFDYADEKSSRIEKQKHLGINGNEKKPFNLQEEYFRLTQNKDFEDWDFVRVARPDGEES